MDGSRRSDVTVQCLSLVSLWVSAEIEQATSHKPASSKKSIIQLVKMKKEELLHRVYYGRMIEREERP